MKRILTFIIFASYIATSICAHDNVLIDGIYYYLDTKKRVAGIYYDYDLAEEQGVAEPEQGSICVDTLVIPPTVKYKNRIYRVQSGSATGLLLINKPCVHTLVIGENMEELYESFFAGFTDVQTLIINSSRVERTDTYMPESVRNVIFGDKVRSVAAMLCADMPNLQTVILPKKMEFIGTEAFAGCLQLTHVVMPEQLNEIFPEAFAGCYRLDNLNIPSTIKSLAADAFSGMLNVKDPRLPYVFAHGIMYGWQENGQLVYNIDPEDVTELYGGCVVNGFGEYPFAYVDSCRLELLGCSPSVTGVVTIPASVRYIAPHTFDYCKKITRIIVPDSVSVISDDAFVGVDSVYYNGTATGAPWGAKVVIKETDK